MSKIIVALRNAMLRSTATLSALEWAGTASLRTEIGIACSSLPATLPSISREPRHRAVDCVIGSRGCYSEQRCT